MANRWYFPPNDKIMNGVHPNTYDLRDYSFERTFGTTEPQVFPDEYNADIGFGFPNQNLEGYPNGCTGYTQSELGQDEIGIPFDPAFVYNNTLDIEGTPPGSPCQIRNSFKATRIYGLKPKSGADDPLTYRRGSFFDVDKVGDYFDGARNALWMNRIHHRTISVGSPWYWVSVGSDGILKDFKITGNAPWHNWKIAGWTTIKGKPYLLVKAWIGPTWADHGYGYMSRDIFNHLMSISGTFLYTQANASPEDIRTIKIDILEFAVDLYKRLLKEVHL